MGRYYTIVTGQLFSFKDRLKNQGISCSWWCLWFSCGFVGTSTSRFWKTNHLRFQCDLQNGLLNLRGRGCLEEAKGSNATETQMRWFAEESFSMSLHGTKDVWVPIGQALHHTMMMSLPRSCVSLLETLKPTWIWTIHWCIVFGPLAGSLHSLDPLSSEASSETKMWWWQVHSRCSLEHWCLVLRHWQRHVGRWVVDWERSPSIGSNSTI